MTYSTTLISVLSSSNKKSVKNIYMFQNIRLMSDDSLLAYTLLKNSIF